MRRNEVLRGAAFEVRGRPTGQCMILVQFVGSQLGGPREEDAPTLMNCAAVLKDPAFFLLHELF